MPTFGQLDITYSLGILKPDNYNWPWPFKTRNVLGDDARTRVSSILIMSSFSDRMTIAVECTINTITSNVFQFFFRLSATICFSLSYSIEFISIFASFIP